LGGGWGIYLEDVLDVGEIGFWKTSDGRRSKIDSPSVPMDRFKKKERLLKSDWSILPRIWIDEKKKEKKGKDGVSVCISSAAHLWGGGLLKLQEFCGCGCGLQMQVRVQNKVGKRAQWLKEGAIQGPEGGERRSSRGAACQGVNWRKRGEV